MADVKVNIGADVRGLKKGVSDAEKEIGGLADAAKKAGADVSDIGPNIEGGMQKGGNAARVLAGVLKGALLSGGILIVTEAVSFLKDTLVDAFQEGQKAAEDAGRAFSSALKSVLEFDLGVEGATVTSRDQLLSLAKESERRVKSLKDGIDALEGGLVGQASNFLKDFFGDSASADISQIKATKALLAEEEGVLAIYKEQLVQLEAQSRLKTRLGGRGLTAIDPGGIFDSLSIDGDDVLGADTSLADEAKLEFQKNRIANLKEEISLFGQVTRQIEKENEAARIQIDTGEQKLLQGELEIDQENRLAAAAARANQEITAGQAILVELGSAGAQALADIALGFEKLESIGDALRSIMRNLIRDLAAAAAKAAILTALFPGASQAAGGFGGLFKGALGLRPFATGGIVTGPTPALIGEAGPEAVIPLDKLSQFTGPQRLEIVGFRMDGGDILFSLRDAQGTRGVGGVSLS